MVRMKARCHNSSFSAFVSLPIRMTTHTEMHRGPVWCLNPGPLPERHAVGMTGDRGADRSASYTGLTVSGFQEQGAAIAHTSLLSGAERREFGVLTVLPEPILPERQT
jgi:hypothetical protein